MELWVRARVDGDPASVVSWRFLGGELVALGPLSGSGDEPLVATWRTVTGDEAPYTVQIRATVRIPGGGRREVDAAIEVSVRSPALVE